MYPFDNAAPQTVTRMSSFAELFDPGTIAHLEARGIRNGWRCLEIGAGGGSIVRWLAHRVGPAGHVLATDIDPRHCAALRLPNVDVRQHDIAVDPLPADAFDLIHARLVLNFVAEEVQVIPRLVTALKPGGWLVVENFEAHGESYRTPGGGDSTMLKTARTIRQIMVNAGHDPAFGRTLGARFRTVGLMDVEMEGRVFAWRGGTAGAALTRANCEELHAALLATGLVTEKDFADDFAKLSRDDFETTSPILWTAWGRRAR
jgi:SAM-dependent methyltransferase